MGTELPCTYVAFGRDFILRGTGSSSGSDMEYEASSEGELIWMMREAVEGSNCHEHTVPDGAQGNYSFYSCSCPDYQEGNPYLPNGCRGETPLEPSILEMCVFVCLGSINSNYA